MREGEEVIGSRGVLSRVLLPDGVRRMRSFHHSLNSAPVSFSLFVFSSVRSLPSTHLTSSHHLLTL